MDDEKITEDFVPRAAETIGRRDRRSPRRGRISSGQASVCRDDQASFTQAESSVEESAAAKSGPLVAGSEKKEVRRRRFERLQSAFLGVCVLLFLFSGGTALFFSGWWGLGSMACFAAAGWIVYKPKLGCRHLDDRDRPAPVYYFRLYSTIALLIALGFALLFLGILKH